MTEHRHHRAGGQPARDPALDALVAGAVNRWADQMASPELAARIAFAAAGQAQQQPARIAPRRRAAGLVGWLSDLLGIELSDRVVWPSAAALAASLMLGVMVGGTDLSAYGIGNDTLGNAWANVDLAAGLYGDDTLSFGLSEETL